MANKIDLHIHSEHSDGSYTTQELINLLHDGNINVFSFTDHDSVGCYNDIESGIAKLYDNMLLIPGVEITCSYNGEFKDILGYGINVKKVEEYFSNKYSIEHKVAKQNNIIKQIQEIAGRLELIFNPNVCATEGKKSEGVIIMQVELSKYQENLQKHPFIADFVDFYWNYISNPESTFFVNDPEDTLTFKEAIDLIHLSDGKAILAHPYHYKMSDDDIKNMILYAIDLGIDGIEIKHPSHTKDNENKLYEFAKTYSLLMSGGSDFHGSIKPDINLATGKGNVNVLPNDIEQLLQNVHALSKHT